MKRPVSQEAGRFRLTWSPRILGQGNELSQQKHERGMVIILMGVSGAGKTTIGKRLADELGWPFFDGDGFHPPANVAKMKQGVPLTDADRWPWLDALQEHIGQLLAEGQSAVVACSALKATYRARLLKGNNGARIVYLKGSYALIERRMKARTDHFFEADLLSSQFEALEEPTDVVTVEIEQEPTAIVEAIKEALQLPRSGS